MNIIANILDAIDGVTGSNDTKTKRAKLTVTIHVAAPLCMPIQGVYDELYSVGIRGDWKETPLTALSRFNLTTRQEATLTVSAAQTKYAGELLWTLAATWPEGLNIKGDPHAKTNREAVARRGFKFPKPWSGQGKWQQPGCKKGGRQ